MKSYVLLLVGLVLLGAPADAGLIKNIVSKITGAGNSTSGQLVRESAPVCGSGVFASADERPLSPEIIFITNRPSRSSGATGERNREVAVEFRFHEENVTISELERHGFNAEAPCSFLVHGFTSGYPLQAWISAIVESYTIDRESARDSSRRRRDHNLFVVNWNYAARGILYPRAVANIPIVASYVTRFINDKLIGEARVPPRRIQLIGHSLGAHLVGFVGKNTSGKLARIYGLDPAGPCFGAISGPLYPASKRLAPGDAEDVITLQTNSALLGIDKPLGRHSVFVEGGAVQPGCKGGGVLKSLGALTWDGADFDALACSHSRAPNLLTYRHEQSDAQDDCQLVAYECKDWESFLAGHCGVCESTGRQRRASPGSSRPLEPVECIRIGLDWQYPESSGGQESHHSSHSHDSHEQYQREPSHSSSYDHSTREPDYHSPGSSNHDSGYGAVGPSDRQPNHSSRRPSQSSREPSYSGRETSSTFGSPSSHNSRDQNYRGRELSSSTRRPNYDSGYNQRRDRRAANSSAAANQTESERRLFSGRGDDDDDVEAKSMFIRTGDTQPYCTYHYQVILTLHEPFEGKKPPMSIILQDSEPEGVSSARHNARDQRERHRRASGRHREQNSLTNDEFGNKFDDKTYTHLLTSGKKLNRVDHATILFRSGLPNGDRILRDVRVNYMSHIDPNVRRRLSTHLCLAKTNVDGQNSQSTARGNRFYFEPCRNGQHTSD